jgi:hypothetical protein
MVWKAILQEDFLCPFDLGYERFAGSPNKVSDRQQKI